jgi:RNA-directed DNA polymerase
VDLTFEEVVQAYFDCRKRKRKTYKALEFEFLLEKNLVVLYEDLMTGRYQIGRSIAFVIEQPRIREIWASTFRDRIVHHIIYNRLSSRFLPSFIRDSFACLPERGTLDGSSRLYGGMRKASLNWHKNIYYLKADVRNFFVSIHKPTLYQLLRKKIHEPWLDDLVFQVLFHDPRLHCIKKSSDAAFRRVPRHKSLWMVDPSRGLPIGNLTSQFFANIYLNELDQFAKHRLKEKYYYRYVDDLVLLGDSSQALSQTYTDLSSFLEERLHIYFHPFKKRIDRISRGVDFVGYIHYPYRRFLRQRTRNKLLDVHKKWLNSPAQFTPDGLMDYRASMNSYMGLLRWTQSYYFRKVIGDQVQSLFAWPDPEYTKISII